VATVNVREASAHFSDLLERVARREEITTTKSGTPVALLIPVAKKELKLTHAEIVKEMRALRKRVKPGMMSIRKIIAEGRRTFL
jgi:prevent-host-death family protein